VTVAVVAMKVVVVVVALKVTDGAGASSLVGNRL
jgi:hypothetical protein